MSKEEKKYEIINKEAIKEFLKDLKYPIYFLDFEAITNHKQWMFEHGFPVDQQLSSFSILRVEKKFDDETKIKHFNFVGEKEDYKLMATRLTDFYKDLGSPVIVWGQDLEMRGLSKLMRESDQSQHKKFGSMISNVIDIQQLFFNLSFIKLKGSSKSSLDIVSKSFGTYLEAKIQNGKKAHFILTSASSKSKEKDHGILTSISKKIQDYNNSDVINMKRILDKIIEEVELEIK